MSDKSGMKRLEGKVAIVTGGAHGIGRAFCLGMAAEGAKVVVADLNLEKANATAEDIRAKGEEALALRVDVSDEKATQEMAKKTVEQFGAIDILVNNAAHFYATGLLRVPFDQITEEEWDRAFNVKAKGAWMCCRAVFPQMKAQRKGKIINISGATGDGGGGRGEGATYVHYIGASAAIEGITRALASEMGKDHINVNALQPGSTLTHDPSSPDYEARVARLQARVKDSVLGHVHAPEDVVGTLIYLASSDSDAVTGHLLHGG